MTQKTHKIAALLIFLALAIGLVSSTQSEDLDEVCNIDGSVMYRHNGNWLCGTLPQPQIINQTNNYVFVNGTLNDTYVRKVGDNMTGNLYITGAGNLRLDNNRDLQIADLQGTYYQILTMNNQNRTVIGSNTQPNTIDFRMGSPAGGVVGRFETDGQWTLPKATAEGQGMLMGGDAEIYRSAANEITLADTTIIQSSMSIDKNSGESAVAWALNRNGWTGSIFDGTKSAYQATHVDSRDSLEYSVYNSGGSTVESQALTITNAGHIGIGHLGSANSRVSIDGNAHTTAPTIILAQSSDAGSNRAAIQYGDWYLGQDSQANTTKDFYMYGGNPVGYVYTIDLQKNMAVTENLTATNIWLPTYAEMWGDHTGEVSLPSANTYINITGYNNTKLERFTYSNGILTVTDAGTYHITSQVSFSGSASQEYHMKVLINEAEQDNCHMQRVIGSGGDVGSGSITCILTLTTNDNIALAMENVDSAGNPTIHTINANIRRIQ